MKSGSHKLTRRQFLKLSGAAATASLLAGCGFDEQPAATPTSGPSETAGATDTPATVADTRRPEIVRFYPDVPSKVVHTHHAGVWASDELALEALQQILDTSITELTGLTDAADAWESLFAPDERVAIKVNAGWFGTHVPLVTAVTERLQEAGIPPEQIFIFEDHTDRLEDAGFTINTDGPGVRCYGDAGWHPTKWNLIDTDVKLNSILLNCDALINMPILKGHSIAGITFALKNHYGSFNKPSAFHPPRLDRGIAELNALPPLKERTRLVIGDALEVNARRIRRGDSIFMSFDPVAHDAVGLQVYCALLASAERSTEAAVQLANGWLGTAAGLGVGTNDLDNINLVEVNLE